MVGNVRECYTGRFAVVTGLLLLYWLLMCVCGNPGKVVGSTTGEYYKHGGEDGFKFDYRRGYTTIAEQELPARIALNMMKVVPFKAANERAKLWEDTHYNFMDDHDCGGGTSIRCPLPKRTKNRWVNPLKKVFGSKLRASTSG